MSKLIDKYFIEAQRHLKVGRTTQAAEIYKKVLLQFPKNKKALQEYQKLKVPPQDAIDHVVKLYNEEHFEEVVIHAENFAEIYPKTIIFLEICGAAYLLLGDTFKTIESYQKVLRLDPNHTNAYNNMGMILHDQGKFDDAVKNYRKVVEIEPEFADGHFNLGNSLREKGVLKEAIESYRVSLKINPNDAEVASSCGDALYEYGDFEKAIKYYTQALKIDASLINIQARIDDAIGKRTEFSKSITDYAKKSKLEIKSAEIINFTGKLLKANGYLDAALDKYKQVIRIKPECPDAHYNIGVLLKERGDWDLALISFQNVLSIKPNDAYANWQIGLVNISYGRFSDAILFLKKALKQDSSVFDFNQLNLKLNKFFPSLPKETDIKVMQKTDGIVETALHCFYDMAISPCSYDFFTFLYSAEICRVRRGLWEIKLFIVHGPKNKFRNDHRSSKLHEVFFNNVIIPGISLLPSVSSFRWLAREEINIEPPRHALFPRDYSVTQPTSEYVARDLVAAQLRGDRPSFLKAPKYALELAENLINQKCSGGSFITLTTRELNRGDLSGKRAIKKHVWQDVFNKMQASDIIPIIIRETDSAHSPKLFKNVVEVPEASIHLPLRMALYEKALLNFSKNNGPASLLIYGNVNGVIFNHIDNDFGPLSLNWQVGNLGNWGNGQYPMSTKSMKMVWETETSDFILNEIKARVSNPQKNSSLHQINKVENIIACCEIGIGQLLRNLITVLLQEDIDLYINLKKINQEFDYSPNLDVLIKKHINNEQVLENFHSLLEIVESNENQFL